MYSEGLEVMKLNYKIVYLGNKLSNKLTDLKDSSKFVTVRAERVNMFFKEDNVVRLSIQEGRPDKIKSSLYRYVILELLTLFCKVFCFSQDIILRICGALNLCQNFDKLFVTVKYFLEQILKTHLFIRHKFLTLDYLKRLFKNSGHFKYFTWISFRESTLKFREDKFS